MKNALEIKDLTKKYNDFMLDHVSFTLPGGCIMGIIGENGAGKSTLIKAILNLIRVDSGQIKILEQSSQSMDTRMKEQIAVVMDECCFPENLNAVQMNQIMKFLYQNWNENKFFSYLKEFSLPEKKVIKEFSRGMKMKLSIAQALSHNAKLLILDEATSGLDPIVRDEILDVFLEFIQDENHSILVTSHIISDLEKICDYITFIHQGKVVFSEEKDYLKDSYGILKCTEKEWQAIDPAAIKGYRKNKFGIEALAVKYRVPRDLDLEPASLEDIMLYHAKER